MFVACRHTQSITSASTDRVAGRRQSSKVASCQRCKVPACTACMSLAAGSMQSVCSSSSSSSSSSSMWQI